MRYNIYLKSFLGSSNILCISEEQLDIIIDSYKKGVAEFSLVGKKYNIKDLHEIQIYKFDDSMKKEEFIAHCQRNNYYIKSMFSTYIPPKYLAKHGENITEQKLGNIQFGETQSKVTNNRDFVDKSRIEELKNINSNNYDLKRLIKLCEEINDNFNNENYLSVGMIGRTIINHIPPIFGLKNFNEVSNNYSNGSQSFKKSMNSLNNSLKNIADGFLHQTIRKTETLPNTTQVNFSQDLDVLLEEIVRILN